MSGLELREWSCIGHTWASQGFSILTLGSMQVPHSQTVRSPVLWDMRRLWDACMCYGYEGSGMFGVFGPLDSSQGLRQSSELVDQATRT